ncbi:unnamed protein product [Cuscuta campestris]|uniref:Protein kinase domain-containing protein n=1 Tax=Cuscuta campestris TaxID=132261 RepID=A0A484MJI8_9ASTE|nr:unnamed protein product [Cuscuta campestris]
MRKNPLKSSKSSVNEARTSGRYDDDAGALVSSPIARSISMKPGVGGSKQKMVVEDVLRYGEMRVEAEVFTFCELAKATNNFNPDLLLGEGGFGRVYKGHIRRTNKMVAVKQLDRNGVLGNREFLAEILTLSLVHHPNLVNLIGYCADGNQRILVFEFMPNGSLQDHLFDLPPSRNHLDWYTRMHIAKGAAQGLEYLHDTVDPPIIFRDFKTSNVLLDKSFNSKLSGFGVAKFSLSEEEDSAFTRIMETYGYCAPEYVKSGEQLTTKSDVYSFGVVLLEIISGRRVIDNARLTEEQNLISWAKPLLNDREKFRTLADPLLVGNYPTKGMYQALAVAAMCLQDEANTRPLIGDIVSALEYLATPDEEWNGMADGDGVECLLVPKDKNASTTLE